MAIPLTGKELALKIREDILKKAANFRVTPFLAALIFGDDDGALYYAKSKARTAEKAGMGVDVLQFAGEMDSGAALEEIAGIADDPKYHGIILEEPVPAGLDADALRAAIPPEMDVDGANPLNLGEIMSGEPIFYPATPLAIIELLKHFDYGFRGKHAVIVGRSRTVGKPLANMLLRKGEDGDATVTVCHSRTPDLAKFTRRADILIVAAGKPELIGAEHVSEGCVVVDVGTNVVNGKLLGDVDFEAVAPIAEAVTPVPGGVGPVTVACILRNCLSAAEKRLDNT